MSKYNGYENYETWCVHLWLSNDESSYNWVNSIIAESEDTYEAEQKLEDALNSQAQEETSHMWLDLLNHALNKVNYNEIINAFEEK